MPRSPPRKRRVRHDIIMEILKIAKNGAKKTEIMYKANLSFFQVEQYLNALKKADFITEKSGIWKTSKEGLYVIDACKICHSLIEKVP